MISNKGSPGGQINEVKCFLRDRREGQDLTDTSRLFHYLVKLDKNPPIEPQRGSDP